MLSVWSARAYEEVLPAVGWHTWCIWFEADSGTSASSVGSGLEGQSGGASSSQSVQQPYAPRVEQVDQRSSGRVYAVTAQDLVPAPSVVRGTFLFCNSVANVLIDTGASHSFVSAAFASILELELA